MLIVDYVKFVTRYKRIFGEKLTESQIQGIGELLTLIRADTFINDLRWVAYMLASVKHECANTWKPIRERGSVEYFIRRYWTNEKIRQQLGNLSEQDAVRYRGRGYIQTTGRRNYIVLGSYLTVDLINNPLRLLEPTISYCAMSMGMRNGFYTTKRLADYINSTECDYVKARRIVNGNDKANIIADYAVRFEKILKPT